MPATPEKLRIFVGFDPRQVISWSACITSLMMHSSKPLQLTPLQINQLPIKRTGLTPFTYSRFLVPWLCDYDGWALFVDADVIFNADPAELFALADYQNAVMVREDPVYKFERAAIMLFNCSHDDNMILTPEYVDDATKCKTPHLIDWTTKVGNLPSEWGHLVGYNEPRNDAKIIHYTQGVPAWPETFECEHGDEWVRMAQTAIWPWQATAVSAQLSWESLMGPSVHAKRLPDGRVVPKLYEPPVDSPVDSPAEPAPAVK